jgi:prepilin signal peptidase PulO-like enzyme (type II secretory pathway)
MPRSRWAVIAAVATSSIVALLRFPEALDRVLLATLIVGGAIQAESDLRTRHVPRIVTYAMAAIVVAMGIIDGRIDSSLIVAIAAVAALFFAVHRWRRDAMGFGDVLLAPVLAMYVGWFDIGALPLWMICASLGAAVLAGVRRQRYVAFVPWMVASAIGTIIYVG